MVLLPMLTRYYGTRTRNRVWGSVGSRPFSTRDSGTIVTNQSIRASWLVAQHICVSLGPVGPGFDMTGVGVGCRPVCSLIN